MPAVVVDLTSRMVQEQIDKGMYKFWFEVVMNKTYPCKMRFIHFLNRFVQVVIICAVPSFADSFAVLEVQW